LPRVAPSGRSAAANGPSCRLPTRLPRHVSSWWSRRYIESRPAATLPLLGVASCARSSSPSPRIDVPGYHHAASNGAGRHVRARSSSSCRVLPRLLRLPPPRLYRLRVWPLLAIAVPTAYTVIFVHYDFAASVIASSSTSLLLQSPTASAALCLATALEPRQLVPRHGVKFILVPLYACSVLATPPRAFVPDASPCLASSDRRLVFIGIDTVFFDIDSYDCLDRVTDDSSCVLGSGKTAVCLRPGRAPSSGKTMAAPRP
jgi:hypothetical protein